MNRLTNHVRSNAIAYVALFFALGGGGAGAAIAATTLSSGTIHACVSKKNGAVYIAKRCGATTRALTLDQRGLPGTSAVVAFGVVDGAGETGEEHGMSITQASPGVYNVVVPACAGKLNVPVATAEGTDIDGASVSTVPVVYVEGSQDSSVNVVVNAGDLVNGSYVPGNQGFTLQDQC